MSRPKAMAVVRQRSLFVPFTTLVVASILASFFALNLYLGMKW